MPDRSRSDAYLKARWPRPLTDEEHRAYVLLCIEEGELRTGGEVQEHILNRLRRERDTQTAAKGDISAGFPPEPC